MQNESLARTGTTLVANCGEALRRFRLSLIDVPAKFHLEYGSKNRILKFIPMRSLLVLD